VPYYEFYCPETHTVYTFFARTLADAGRVPRCPDPAHPGGRMEKRVSRFAVTGKAEERSGDGPDAEDPRLERAMAEMEREFSSLGDAEPDPRTLGRLMRKMGGLMGGAWSPEMEEMARRLEAGEDPDKLEERFGDAFGEDGPEEGGLAPGDGGGGIVGRTLRRRRAEPKRDPNVYEMKDYLGDAS